MITWIKSNLTLTNLILAGVSFWGLAGYYTRTEVFQRETERRLVKLEQDIQVYKNEAADTRIKWAVISDQLLRLQADVREVKEDTKATRRAVQ